MSCLSNCSLKLPLDMAKHRYVFLSARKMLPWLLQWIFWLRGNCKIQYPVLWSSWPGNAIVTPLHRARWHLGNQIHGSSYMICTTAPKTRLLLFRRLQRRLLGTAISCGSNCRLFSFLNNFCNLIPTSSLETQQLLQEILLPRSEGKT